MEKNSLPTNTTTATTTAIITEHKPPAFALIKKEYIDDKHDGPRASCENCSGEVTEKPKHKYRGINRDRGKEVTKKNISWPVRDVCEVRSEAIIWAVEQLPCLWNLACEDYRDRSKRRQGWSTVSRMLIHDFEKKNLTERQRIEKEIQSKWKNIRDCYVRDVRRKNGEAVKSRGKRTREYVHAGSLAFLGGSARSSRTNPKNTCDFILNNVVKPFLGHNAQVNCDWIKQETLEEKLGIILEERSLDDDEDSAFFSTLLPTVRNLDPEQKVEFRLEVLQALRQIVTKQLLPPLFLQSENLDNLDIDFNAILSRISSGTGSIFSGSDLLALQFQAAEDFIMSLRDI
uniref:MADF domain-containing protein n=1 Tax=Elaeophora elaphi TaxID=1147741 RepID=A0A158Q924_9BILA